MIGKMLKKNPEKEKVLKMKERKRKSVRKMKRRIKKMMTSKTWTKRMMMKGKEKMRRMKMRKRKIMKTGKMCKMRMLMKINNQRSAQATRFPQKTPVHSKMKRVKVQMSNLLDQEADWVSRRKN